MGLSNNEQCIQVTLVLTDWAVVIAALSRSSASLEEKERINAIIFQSAHDTVPT